MLFKLYIDYQIAVILILTVCFSKTMEKNRTIVVTGGTAGIGEEAAKTLAEMGFRIVIVGRNSSKGIKLQEEVSLKTKSNNFSYIQADLSSQKEVRRVAKQINNSFECVDVLLNNAGAVFTKREISLDGIEMTFALNHLSYFLLTKLLLEKLRKSTSARIINVSSVAHKHADLDFSDIQFKQRNYMLGWKAYAQSKLCNIMFTYALDRKLSGSGVAVNSLHPGFVNSKFGDNNKGLGAAAFQFLKNTTGISVKQGAKTSIFLATSVDLENKSGGYYYKCREVSSSQASYNHLAQKKLWDISEKLIRKN